MGLGRNRPCKMLNRPCKIIIKPLFMPSNNFATLEFAFFSPENTTIPAFNEQLQHCNTSLIALLTAPDRTDSLGAGEGFWEQPGAGAVPGQGWDVRMLPFRRSIDVSGSFQSSPARLVNSARKGCRTWRLLQQQQRNEGDFSPPNPWRVCFPFSTPFSECSNQSKRDRNKQRGPALPAVGEWGGRGF